MEPTGAQHEVGVDELFFSTTDARGIIEESNSIFTALSRYSAEELHGSPHNIIRHPMMPGGAFYAMWTTIENGDPFAAYVHNLAKDGSRYDVLATITPLSNGGYLSVRTRPMREDLFGAADAIYTAASAEEEKARSTGANRHEAAVIGATVIAKSLKDAGYDTYADFMYEVLPAEVLAREAASSGIPERPDAQGEYADKLRTAHQIFVELNAWMTPLDQMNELSESLKNTGEDIKRDLGEASVPEYIRFYLEKPEMSRLREVVQVWEQMQGLVDQYLAQVLEQIADLREDIAFTRFRIALARLHGTMLANYLAEVIDNGTEANTEIRLLRESIIAGVQEMGKAQSQMQILTNRTAETLTAAASMTAITTQMVEVVKQQGETMTDAEREVIPQVIGIIEKSGNAIDEMNTLAAQCRSLAAQDQERLRELVYQL
ncbi:MAG: histidine kinase [Varibaculum sp.]|nr:histidine kinase [Varibaculum sp.]